MDFIERKVVKLSEDLYSIEEGFVRWFLLIGEEKAAVIDTGVIGNGARELAKSLTDKELILINTHGDGDHTAGNGDFERFYIAKEDFINLNMAARFSKAEPEFVTDGQIIDIGDRPLEIITLPGHTKGSIAIYDRRTKSLFAGDTIQDGIVYMFGEHRNPGEYKDALYKLMQRVNDFDVIYASHGKCDLHAEQIELMAKDWEDVASGVYTFEEMELHGQNVKCYKAQNCGFYLR